MLKRRLWLLEHRASLHGAKTFCSTHICCYKPQEMSFWVKYVPVSVEFCKHLICFRREKKEYIF